MWVFRYFRFVRWQRAGKRLSIRSLLMLPIVVPILIVQVALISVMFAVMMFIAMATPKALDLVARAIADAKSSGEIDKPFLHVRGGVVRQAGSTTGFRSRYGGDRSSDVDWRRRLNKPRSVRTGNPAHRSQTTGGHHGKYKTHPSGSLRRY